MQPTRKPLPALVIDAILDHTSILFFPALMVLNKAWYCCCLSYLRRKQQHILNRYIHDGDQFRSLMRTTSSLLTGSEVLDLSLHATSIPRITARDLNIYTTPLHCVPIIRYLRDVEGYYVSPMPYLESSTFIDDADDGRVESKALVHTIRRTKIMVTASPSLSATFTVAHAPSTIDMNYMTADRLVISYPSLTVQGIGILSQIPTHIQQQKYKENAEARGLRIRTLDMALVSARVPSSTSLFVQYHALIWMPGQRRIIRSEKPLQL